MTTVSISNTFSYFGFAELVFDQSGILEYDHTNLQYDNLKPVFNHITGGTGTRREKISTPFAYGWDVILANVERYNNTPECDLDKMFGTYRGNPNHDSWAEFHCAPRVILHEK